MIIRPGKLIGVKRAPLIGSMASILGKIGYTTNLRLLLDAGDADSYTSGQKWLDRAGSGYDFFVGADGSATSTDPTFNGVAGAASSAEYFSFDGGDYFTYDTTNESWMDNIHKNNAKFTFITWIFPVSFAATFYASTGSATNQVGFVLGFSGGGAMTFQVFNGSGTAAYAQNGSTVSASAWQMLGTSIDEENNARIYSLNAAISTGTATYSSPSSSASAAAMKIGARADGNARIGNTSRMAVFAAWEGRALSASDLQTIFYATRRRFGV